MPSRTSKKRSSRRVAEREAGIIGDTAFQVQSECSASTCDEETVRSALKALKRGSVPHILLMSAYICSMTTHLAAETIEVLCDLFVESSSFPPDKNLPAFLAPKRAAAFASLYVISQFPANIALHGEAAIVSATSLAIENHWRSISNWILHFLFFPDQPTTLNTHDSNDDIPDIFTVAPRIIDAIFSSEKASVRLIIGSDELLDIVVKIWSDVPTLSSERRRVLDQIRCSKHLYDCFDRLSTVDPRGHRRTKLVMKILRGGKLKVRVVAKTLVRRIRISAESSSQSVSLVASTLAITGFLAIAYDESTASCSIAGMFLDCLLEEGLVRSVSNLISFISDNLFIASDKTSLSNSEVCYLLVNCLSLMTRCIEGRTGQYWLTILLRRGFLRDISRILSTIPHPGSNIENLLIELVGTTIPAYLSQRAVVVSAIEAMKALDVDGGAAGLQHGFLQRHWSILTNIVLERTAFKTLYDRDSKDKRAPRCENCSKSEQETALFLCAGCHAAKFCSRACQIESWKFGQHRQHCKSGQQVLSDVGQNLTDKEGNFVRVLALAEVRRHLPGVSKQLATLANPSGIPLRDAGFQVAFTTVPPTITVYHRKSPPDEPLDADNYSHINQLRDEVRREDRLIVYFFWGGKSFLKMASHISESVRLFDKDFNYAGVSADEIEDRHLLLRQPARDKRGKELAFVLDDIDRLVMNARKHFRPPGPGDDKSPKTIYDYIEAGVEKDPSFMCWLDDKMMTVESLVFRDLWM